MKHPAKFLMVVLAFSGVTIGNVQAQNFNNPLPTASVFSDHIIKITSEPYANGYSVQMVFTPTGRYFNNGNGNWAEVGNDGGQFDFREMQRDEWSVYLRDDNRGVNIQLDLHTKEVKYSDDNGQSFVLTQIIDSGSQMAGGNSGQVENAVSSVVAEYTCNEGIPLILTFENEGNDSWVSWSHDGFQGPSRLPNVISGSGSKYSDGRNTVWENGQGVYLNLDGIEDNCTKA